MRPPDVNAAERNTGRIIATVLKDDLSAAIHVHEFDRPNPAAERGTRLVLWITLGAMAVEILAGWWANSMALLADGWHMSSHAVAIGLSAFAYAAARRYARDPSFAIGTRKIEILGGFASAVLLLVVAGLMAAGSVERLLAPQPIHFAEAMVVAFLGLAVNVGCAAILHRAQGHGHGHAHHHDHDHAHPHPQDLNLRSAFVHVVADAATSVLAIAALAGGWLYGWAWLDPVMGLVGAVLVAFWARGLATDTSKILLDREMDHPVVDEIRAAVETGPVGETRITDLHVWRVGKQAYSCALTLVTHDARLTPAQVRARLSEHGEIVHTTIEIHRCPDA